ncbi:MAG: hypothetical protein PWQ96_1092 [Clostridia bacterium]|jgi:ferredoxin|nr:4Fe-4S ferredoxin iron-sulfur binding domain protein [Clostridiales bacterium]MDK2985450.1 hypothetical protein [Clostridia bacterium]
MVVRKIIQIDEDKCNGCGLCVPACHEGALQIVDGKAKLVSDKYCDGLGDCLGECPQDAIKIVEREADEYDDKAVQERLAKLNKEKEEGDSCHTGGCPGSRMMSFVEEPEQGEAAKTDNIRLKSQLRQWPVQITLVPPDAPYFEDASLLVCADCVPFAYPNLHNDFMKDRVVLVGCPKLDNAEHYLEKFAEIFRLNNIKDITLTRMEVPCCGGMRIILEKALQIAGKDIPINDVVVGIKGDLK